jgi:hypothetical protein
MKKIGETHGKALLSVNATEFKALTGTLLSSSVDGEEYDVSQLTTLRALLEEKRTALVSVRNQCLALAQSIADMA